MEETRGISSGDLSEPSSNSGLLGEKRNEIGSEENEGLGFKSVKAQYMLYSDTKTSNLQSDANTGIAQQPNHNNEMVVAPDAEGLGRLVREKKVLAKVVKPPTVLETSTCLPKANSIASDDDRCVANSGNQALLENHNRNCESRGGHVDGVSKNSSLLKPVETSESIKSRCGAADSELLQQDPLRLVPNSEKVGPFKMCSAAGSLGESDSMRLWREMKRNGFVSGPLGGVAAPSSAVSTSPVEIPPQKQQRNKRKGDSFKKRNEVPKREQQQVDRFSNVTAPSGLLTELNPGIIKRVRSMRQVHSSIEAMIRNATDDATMGDRHANLNVRESSREDMALNFRLPSTGVSDNANAITNPEQAMSLAVEAATVASQWLEFLHQDLSGRLSAVQESRNRVQNILTNEEITLQMTNTNTSGDASSDKTVTETHHIGWFAKFDQFSKALHDEERDLERTLNQVKEMQSQCNKGLQQMDECSAFSSQSSDSSFGKDRSQETSMAVFAAAASIFSTSSFLLSKMTPPPTGS